MLKEMSEEMYDKVDKFHEALLKRYSRKTLVAAIIFIALFISWFVYATYNQDSHEAKKKSR